MFFATWIEYVPHVNAQDPPLWMMLYARVQFFCPSFLNYSCDASTRECAGPAPLDDVVYNGPNRFLLVSVVCPAARPHVNARVPSLPVDIHALTGSCSSCMLSQRIRPQPALAHNKKQKNAKPALCLESLPCPHQTNPCTQKKQCSYRSNSDHRQYN